MLLDDDPSQPRAQASATESSVRAHSRHRQVRSGGAHLWEGLVREGVEVVFGYPGGMIMPAYDALPEFPIRHVLVRHEQGAAHMADGYARASGRVGVVVATSGPGATNLVTGIANAMMDSIPLVCITGQVPSSLLGTDAFQETDIQGITLPITKDSILVQRARDILPALRRAFAVARAGRPGPVLVDITKDAQLELAPIFEAGDEEPAVGPARFAMDPEEPLYPDACENDVRAVLAMIASAQRPLILAGHGIVQADAASLLREFAERADIPVASTLLGLSALPGGHPLRLGMMGMHGDAWVNRAIQSADLLIALGMRFDDRATSKLTGFAPHAKKIHVDLDRAELHKNVPVDLAIACDVRRMLAHLRARCPASVHSAWRAEIDGQRHAASAHDILHRRDDGRLYGAHVVHALCDLTGGEATVVTDVGQHQMWAAQYYRPSGRGRFITSGGLGTMGFALPAAIGAKLARPDEEVWVIAGDGGFQMTASELSTITQEGLALHIAVINNGHLGLVRQQQQLFHEGRYVASRLTGPDFVMLARAHGIEAMRVHEPSHVAEALQRCRASRRSMVVEFCVEPLDMVYPTVPAGASLDEMIRRPPSTGTHGGQRAIGGAPHLDPRGSTRLPPTATTGAVPAVKIGLDQMEV